MRQNHGMLDVRPDRLLRAILGWTAVTLLLVWLPLVRGVMDGVSYVWAKSYWGLAVGGSGVGGYYWLLLVEGLVGLSILWLGWRGGQPPVRWLLLIWHGVLGTNSIYESIRNPEQYRFRGDTLGIDVSLAWVGPLFFGGFFLLCLLWAIRDRRSVQERSLPSWSRTNTSWLAALLFVIPVQFVLLRFGDEHGLTDQIGVVVTIAQCLLLGRIFRASVVKHVNGSGSAQEADRP